MAGRPREFDIDSALIKAKDAFWERGYEGVSMSDLTSILGIASARIYAAFGSKEELFRKAVESYLTNEGGFVKRALENTTTAKDFVNTLLIDAVELYTNTSTPKGCMVVLSATNYTRSNTVIYLWLEKLRSQQASLIINRLQQAIDLGELPANTNVQLIGDYISTLLNGLSVQARDGISKERLLETVKFSMGLFP